MIHRVVFVPDIDNYGVVHVAPARAAAAHPLQRVSALNPDEGGLDELLFGLGDLPCAHTA